VDPAILPDSLKEAVRMAEDVAIVTDPDGLERHR
jgi:hypothetical protein